MEQTLYSSFYIPSTLKVEVQNKINREQPILIAKKSTMITSFEPVLGVKSRQGIM
jgi:hypothetical protein